MSRRAAGLTALSDAEATPAGWMATGAEPWLRLDFAPKPGGWLRLVYAAGLLDPLIRPVLRFVGRREVRDELLPAAMLGRAEWIGQTPDDVTEIEISPTLGAGPFAFRVERCETLSQARALAHFGPRGIGRAAQFVWGQWRGWDRFARLQARRALGPTPLSQYAAWRRTRERPFEPGFDGADAATTPRFVILAADADSAADLQPMLNAQIWPHWTLARASAPGQTADDDYVLALAPGDRLEPYALASLAAQVRRDAAPDALYADEDAYFATQRQQPRLKPDWSPLFFAAGYAGAPLAVRGSAFKAGGVDPASARVSHTRRILLSRARPAPIAPAPPAPAPDVRRQATIIVPTRDRLDLIGPCVESLRRYDAGADFEMIVIDNGSQDAQTLAFLDQLDQAADARVLRRPGPFNFSAICNDGARAARFPFLAFLNNDVRALQPGWLGQMLAYAAMPGVGAVGSKLLYPDGRLQHGGVVLGLDGFAGHVQRAVSADDPGYLGMLAWPREVAAVTGACMAVEAAKFFAVDGFDQTRLPIEYNDIDLCLRLAERGWRNVVEPRAVLEHRESASRGQNPWLDARYDGEHDYFRQRWARSLRDDPYFHPALSLDALEITLG